MLTATGNSHVLPYEPETEPSPQPHQGVLPNPGGKDARGWSSVVAAYKRPSNKRALIELAITAAPLAGLWVVMWLLLERGIWAGLLLAIPAAGFLVRLFIIQHDCGHGAFFRHRWANDWLGRIIGVLTFTPYDYWKHTHAIHHASSGSLDRRGFGDVHTLTVAEYEARSPLGRLMYRTYRHPVVLFGLGPAYMFILQHRLPICLMKKGWRPWASVMGTNLAILTIAGLVTIYFGWKAFLLVYLPVTVLAATLGVWLFYVQHQFEHTVWEKDENWRRFDTALHGSSHYDLPSVLHWITGNIGIHHVHHLCSQIPFYRLPAVLRDHPPLGDVNRMTVMESLRCVRLTLWDETQRRMVTFREAASGRAVPAA